MNATTAAKPTMQPRAFDTHVSNPREITAHSITVSTSTPGTQAYTATTQDAMTMYVRQDQLEAHIQEVARNLLTLQQSLTDLKSDKAQ